MKTEKYSSSKSKIKNPSDQNTCFDVLYNSILKIEWVVQSNVFVILVQKVTKCSIIIYTYICIPKNKIIHHPPKFIF